MPAAGLAQAMSPSPSPAFAAPVVNPFTGKASPSAPAPADFTPVPERPKRPNSDTVVMQAVIPMAPMHSMPTQPSLAPMPQTAPAAPVAPVSERPAIPKPVAAPQKPALAMVDAQEPARPVRGGFLLTTSPTADGRKVGNYLGVVSVEIVIPKDILFRNPAPYGELHRIKAAEDQLQSVKKKAFEELTERAKVLGADGIVGATLQFSQFDAVVFLCAAVGTAVKFE